MNCSNCGATTTNGLALCELCQRWVTTALDLFPVYFRNLARWKPGRAGSRPVPGSRVLWDGAEKRGDRVMTAMDEASNAVSTWARMLVADRPFLAEILPVEPIAADLSGMDERDQFPLLCVGLGRHLTSEEHAAYVSPALVAQLDLVAMRHGYAMTSEPWDEHPDEWALVTFTRIGGAS